MPRRYRPPKRKVDPDPKYNDVQLAMFINRVMKNGKKSTAQRLMYDALDIIEQRTSRNPLDIFKQALNNAMPMVEVKPRRVGGSTYQVPVEVSSYRRMTLGMRWLLQSARARAGRGMAEKLANELMDAANGQGATIKKKDDTHRMAEANRTFAHYRW
nr:30S ribosomal protein S7 [Anaerolineae bacterium]